MFDLILVVAGLVFFVVAGEFLRNKAGLAQPIVKEEEKPEVHQPVGDLNKRELNEEFLDLAMRLLGHRENGADVYREGGSIVVKYPSGKGWKVSLFSQKELRQPRIVRPADVVQRSNGHKPVPVSVSHIEEPDWLQEAFAR